MKEKNVQQEKPESGLRKRRIVSIIILLVFVGIFVFLFLNIGVPLVEFVSDSERLRAWVDSNWLWSRLAYTGLVILQIIVALIPGEPFEIAAGYAFGAVEGTIICVLGSTIGGTLVFLLTRRFGIKLVEVFVSIDKINSIRFLKDSKKRDILLFLLFFIPGTPKDALSYFAGLTKIDLKTWLLITTVAKLPSIITSTVGGNAIGMENHQFAIIVFAATLLLSSAGLLFYNHYTKRKQEEAAALEADSDKERKESDSERSCK